MGARVAAKKAMRMTPLVVCNRVLCAIRHLTSSPSPMQSPSRLHVDQFHGYTAMDNNALSIASSRLPRRFKNRALLTQRVNASFLVTEHCNVQKDQPRIGRVLYGLQETKDVRVDRHDRLVLRVYRMGFVSIHSCGVYRTHDSAYTSHGAPASRWPFI